jgi:hypothetical protein
MDQEEVISMDDRTPVNPWTEVPYVPMEASDPTDGGRFLSDAREINIGDGGDNVFRVDRQGLWLGARLYDDAPFRVSMLGAVIAESLTILGGVITGALIQTSALAATGIKIDTNSFRAYGPGGFQTLLIDADDGFIQVLGSGRSLTLAADAAQSCARLVDGLTYVGFEWRGSDTATPSTAARQNVAAFKFAGNTVHGDGFTAENTEDDWDGDFFRVINSAATKASAAFRISDSPWTGSVESQITSDGYLDFPMYHHVSEFDETPAVLASSVIAKLFWTGGGTSGTQEIFADGSNGLNDEITYLRLSTTATGSRSSTLTSQRSFDSSMCRWDALLRFNTDLTDTARRWGWYYDSTHYAYFYFDTATHATKLYFAYNNGGSIQLVDLGIDMPDDGLFHRFTIQIYVGKIYVYVDQVLESEISTSINNLFKSYFYVDNKTAAEEKVIDIDYVKMWQRRSRNI